MNIKNIQILSEAEEDLEDGRRFYEKQEKGVGEYFRDTLISDIESLFIQVCILKFMVITV